MSELSSFERALGSDSALSQSDERGRIPTHHLLAQVSGAIALIVAALVLLLRFLVSFVFDRGAYNYAAWVEDDFFYYSVIAQNILERGLSTFDGVTLTNGYHPLWMVICVGLGVLFQPRSDAFFLAVFIVQSGLVLWGVHALGRLLRMAGERRFMSTGAILAATCAYGVAGSLIAARGMEIALLWPLMPLLLSALWRLHQTPTLTQASLAAGLFSTTVLARLDAGIVFAPVCLAAAVVLVARYGVRPILRLAPAVLGFLPILAYLAFNAAVFDYAAPISGLAKRLMVDGAAPGPSMLALSSVLEIANPNFFFVPLGAGAATLAGLAAVAMTRRLRASTAGAGFLLVCLGVLAFYAQAVITSDWRLWVWYHYALSLTGALSVGLLIDLGVGLAARLKLAAPSAALWTGVIIAVVVTTAALRVNIYKLRRPPSQTNALFIRAIPVAEFARTHPGRYAMGDGAGAVAFLLPNGLVQLEGLVSDAAMIDDIRRQGAIVDSLKRQKIDYYIATDLPEADGCTTLTEPKQGGSRAPRMSQRVCQPPVFTNETLWIETSIWDVRDGLD